VAKVTLERFRQVPLAGKLSEDQVNTLLPRVEELTLAPGETLFRQNEPLAFLYYVEKGAVREGGGARVGSRVVSRLAGPGDYLGRYGLATGQLSRLTATAEEDSTLLAIPLRDLQPILFSLPNWRTWFFKTDVAARLRAVPLFMEAEDWDIYRLADQVQVQEFAPGDPIFHVGSAADSVYVVDRGQVKESAPPSSAPSGDWPRYLTAGDFFGRSSLRADELRRASAVAQHPTRLFRISAATLFDLFGGPDPLRKLPRVDIVQRLKGVPLLSTLSDQRLRLLAGYVSLVYYRPGDTISRQGEPATGLLILDDGEAVIRRQIGQGRPRPVGYRKAQREDARMAGPGNTLESIYFGDHALLSDEIRGATVEATKPSTWIILARQDFQRFLADAGLAVADLKQVAKQSEQVSAPHPADVDRLELPFETQRHWIVQVMQVAPLAIVVIGVLLVLVADFFWSNPPELLRGVVMWAGIGLLVLLIPWTVWQYINWRNDTFTVTNEGVAHIERVPFPFPSENRYEVPLAQIQNVNIHVSAIGRVLGYGNLSLDTAAVRGQVTFTRIPQPGHVQELIQRAAAEARSGREVQLRQSIRQQLEDQLEPDRLKPEVPESVLVPAEARLAGARRQRRERKGRKWVRFEIRENGRVTWRKHWLNLLRRTGLPVLALLLATYLVVAQILLFLTQKALNLPNPLRLPPMAMLEFSGGLFLAMLFLWVVALLWVVYQYQDWRNDIYIVTDNEVIDVERDLAIFPFWNFYTESRQQASLDKVQNVNLRIPNLIASALGFGDVIVQTAGAEGSLDFLFVGNPRHVQAEILRRLSAYQERRRQREFKDRWGGMAEWFETYKKLTDEERAKYDSGQAHPGTP
jgi:CRP-like cAMP-binding protein/uncharacterized membrane protein YdbT with pleckstrin-like domain